MGVPFDDFSEMPILLSYRMIDCLVVVWVLQQLPQMKNANTLSRARDLSTSGKRCFGYFFSSDF
jgi:hypothetical protein